MDIRKYKKFYFIGIKGVGMTMLAQFLHGLGKDVCGSDIADTFMTDKVLKSEGIPFRLFDAKKIPQDSVIIYSSAYTPQNNEEVAFIRSNARMFKKPVMEYAEAIGALFSSYNKGIAVCGSHGKTTVSAWLGHVLRHSGLDANVLVGARVPQFKASAVRGESDVFVAEADEYQDKLRHFQPYGIVLNNVDYDHPDFFKNKKEYADVFQRFISRLPKSGFLVANVGDPESAKLLPGGRKVISYGLDKKIGKNVASFVASDIQRKDGKQSFALNDFGRFQISLFGDHNIENALAVISACHALGLEPQKIRKALASFRGTARRAELMGRYRGIPVYDDYGHHPTEVQATLGAFKEAFPGKRLVAVFHPHTFTRTKALYKDFLKSFDQADVLGILEIYGSAREKQGGISSKDLIIGMKEKGRKKPARYLKDFDQALSWLEKTLKKDDVLLLIGAGDIFRVGERLISKR